MIPEIGHFLLWLALGVDQVLVIDRGGRRYASPKLAPRLSLA